MTLKDFLKTTEALVVLLGLFFTFVYSKLFAIPTACIYILINVPNIWNKIKNTNIYQRISNWLQQFKA